MCNKCRSWVASVNREDETCCCTNGELIPITNWFDEEGDDCDPEDAITCVAGPMANGKWLGINFACLEAEKPHIN